MTFIRKPKQFRHEPRHEIQNIVICRSRWRSRIAEFGTSRQEKRSYLAMPAPSRQHAKFNIFDPLPPRVRIVSIKIYGTATMETIKYIIMTPEKRPYPRREYYQMCRHQNYRPSTAWLKDDRPRPATAWRGTPPPQWVRIAGARSEDLLAIETAGAKTLDPLSNH